MASKLERYLQIIASHNYVTLIHTKSFSIEANFSYLRTLVSLCCDSFYY